ncbi:MAG TPA: TetR/AcrR family transcriptional regulator [Acidimicrobiales bacterium]|nr:TetR/AcrR family transcriptional regulator [Acidimicrobiales bacterium]
MSTRERIVEEAMRLFAERGFKGTSISEIEAAAGLAPGSGGLYHHFDSKDAVLAAGVARHLSRLDALREIRRVFSGLGDLPIALTLTARYYLAELDSQTELLRLLASEARRRPDLLREAAEHLVASTFSSFAEWLAAETDRSPADCEAVARLALGALLSSRLTVDVFGCAMEPVDDEQLIGTWTKMVLAAVEPPGA